MTRRFSAVLVATIVLSFAGLGVQEPVDREMVERIKDEGSERSRVGELFNHFTNVIGGRLTASPAHREAAEYARGRLEGWGLDNVHLEAWEFGRGWTLERFSIEMFEPRYMPMIGYPHGWSLSTDGRLVAEPVFLGDTTPETLGDRAGTLGGAIVLTRPIQTDFVREDRPAPRADYRLSSAPPRPTAEEETARAAASGATDNADGSSVAMEALRILEALDVRPRRTIRLALWSGEEQGLLGSREYVRQHLEGDANQAERDRFSVYFNLDNGQVPIFGFYLEGSKAMRPIMDAYLRPFQDYTSMYNTQQGIGAADHLSFLRMGVPGYRAIHDYTDYDVRTHHTNMDTFDRIDEEGLVHAAVVMASILYHAAVRDEQMPRDPTWRPGR